MIGTTWRATCRLSLCGRCREYAQSSSGGRDEDYDKWYPIVYSTEGLDSIARDFLSFMHSPPFTDFKEALRNCPRFSFKNAVIQGWLL